MKHLLNGVAIAAALAFAAPAWAQAPMSPSSSSAAKPAATAPAKKEAAAMPATEAKRPMRHARRGKARAPSEAAQLNRAELARLQGAAPAAAMPSSSTTPARIGAPKQP